MADWETDFEFNESKLAVLLTSVPEAMVGETVNISIVHNGNEGTLTLAVYDANKTMLGTATATPGNGATVSFPGVAGNLGAVTTQISTSAPQAATMRIGPRTEDGGPPAPNPLQGPMFPGLPPLQLGPLLPWIDWLKPYYMDFPWPTSGSDPRGSDGGL
jgi:hypothetical protein